MKTSNVLITEPSADYELVDSGQGEKLERFGKILLSRPDPQALWSKNLGEAEWKKSDGIFTRDESSSTKLSAAHSTALRAGWSLKEGTPANWPIELGGLKFLIKPTPFKHVGLFPEHVENWKWLQNRIKNKVGQSSVADPFASVAPNPSAPLELSPRRDGLDDCPLEILNLFGYTGGATLACAKAGAKVVHVDGSKSAIAWARENAELSGLTKAPVRWILEDARSFVKREIKRERKYDGIIMDPPAFGHGPENEVWKIEDDFLPLVEDCLSLLKDKPIDGAQGGPAFFLINGYASGYSALAYENILMKLKEKNGGSIETGELAIREKGCIGQTSTEKEGRLLPCGIFARWCSK